VVTRTVSGSTASHAGRDRGQTGDRSLSRATRRSNMDRLEKQQVEPLNLEIEVLEERIAPSVTGSGGYEGQPGGQSGGGNNGDGSNENTGFEGQPGGQSNG
jgi:hypothetical protein